MDDRHFNINDRFGALPTSAPHAGGGTMKRYGPGWGGIEPEDDGDYVEYDEAAARIAALEAALRPFAEIAAAIDDDLDATRAKWDDPELGPPPHLTDADAEVRFMQWGGDDEGYVEIEEFRSDLTLADFRAARAALTREAGNE